MQKKSGFTLVEIMIVVAIIGLLAGIAIPAFIRARENSQTTVCLNNLRQIDAAKDQWSMDSGVNTGTPTMAILVGGTNYIKKLPLCPVNGTYDIAALGTDPTCGSASANHPATL